MEKFIKTTTVLLAGKLPSQYSPFEYALSVLHKIALMCHDNKETHFPPTNRDRKNVEFALRSFSNDRKEPKDEWLKEFVHICRDGATRVVQQHSNLFRNTRVCYQEIIDLLVSSSYDEEKMPAFFTQLPRVIELRAPVLAKTG